MQFWLTPLILRFWDSSTISKTPCGITAPGLFTAREGEVRGSSAHRGPHRETERVQIMDAPQRRLCEGNLGQGGPTYARIMFNLLVLRGRRGRAGQCEPTGGGSPLKRALRRGGRGLCSPIVASGCRVREAAAGVLQIRTPLRGKGACRWGRAKRPKNPSALHRSVAWHTN